MPPLTVTDLASRLASLLASKCPLGASILIDFGSDGQIFVHPTNLVERLNADDRMSSKQPASCTISLSLASLAKFASASDFTRAWMLMDGEVAISGDRQLAERFGNLLKGLALT